MANRRDRQSLQSNQRSPRSTPSLCASIGTMRDASALHVGANHCRPTDAFARRVRLIASSSPIFPDVLLLLHSCRHAAATRPPLAGRGLAELRLHLGRFLLGRMIWTRHHNVGSRLIAISRFKYEVG